MALFGIIEIKDFAENHDDERVRIMYQRFVESRSKQAQQHERIVMLEKFMSQAVNEFIAKAKTNAASS
jgi:hypothetical protein